MESACRKEGIKPLFGVELYAGGIGEEATQRKNHLTVLAADQEGYQNLLSLVTKSYSEGFHYEPTADGAMLAAHKRGLVVLSGCQSSLLFTSLCGGKLIDRTDASYQRAKSVARHFRNELGDQYYIELQAFPELDQTVAANPELCRIGEELGIPCVVTFDCHYTVPEEKEMQQILHQMRPGERRTMEEMVRDWGYDANLCPPWTDSSIVRKLQATGLSRAQSLSALANTREVADRCNVTLPSLPMVRYPLPPGYTDSVQLWRQWIKDGWKYRGCHRLNGTELRRYKERLAHEIKIIEDKDFVDYFLIISDLVRWTKDSDIAVGPARGSAAGSLVCWLLRITEVNPMLFDDLVFERFIDVTRQDLPDIDIDFSSDQRSRVWEYVNAKYGSGKVSNVGTFTKFKGRNSLDAAARVYGVPKWEIDNIKDVLIERSSGDLRASATIEDTAEQFPQAREVFERHPDLGAALDLEGNYAGFGVHSAGLVISTGPITEVCAIYEREIDDEIRRVISMDKYDAEKKGLLKIDALGLNTTQALDHMRKEMGWSLDDLYSLPLDDEETLEGFRDNDVTGIFQFDGRACRYVNGALRPDHFKHVYDVTALGRPGPLHNGAANSYIEVKWEREEPLLLHPAMSNICDSTYGQIVYQEQILRILGDVFNFDWTHRAEVRRIISKKHGDQEFNRKWDEAWKGAQKLHSGDGIMTAELARTIWMRLITAGSYAFNASHAVAYGMIGFQTMWFKRHEPDLFFASRLNTEPNAEKRRRFMRDTQRHGRKIPVKAPDPSLSQIGWTRRNGTLLAGFREVPTIGDAVADKIVSYRKEYGIRQWEDMENISGVGPVTIAKIRALEDAGDDPFGAMWLDRAISEVKRAIWEGELGELPMPTHVASDLPYERGQDMQITWLGCVYTRNERDLFEFNQAKGAELDMEEMTLNGKPIKDPHLDKWVVMVGDDESDQIGLRVDRWHYPKLRDKVWKMRPGKDLILVSGYKPGFLPTRQIWINNFEIIDPEI
jgi:DNA polymerase-3 subunit alpha